MDRRGMPAKGKVVSRNAKLAFRIKTFHFAKLKRNAQGDNPSTRSLLLFFLSFCFFFSGVNGILGAWTPRMFERRPFLGISRTDLWSQVNFKSLKTKKMCFSGTDRNNMVETRNPLDNYPLPWEMSKLFRGAKISWTSLEFKSPKAEDIAVSLATAGMHYLLLYFDPKSRQFSNAVGLFWPGFVLLVCKLYVRNKLKHSSPLGTKLHIRAIFVWPWNENARTKQQTKGNRVIWLVYRTDTNVRGVWLVKWTHG